MPPARDPGSPHIIDATWIIPVVPRARVLEDHAVVVRDGRIDAVLPRSEAVALHPQAPAMRLDGHALIPGLVNAHTHAAMALMRGFADDLPLERWLGEYIWPLESRVVNAAFVRDGSALAIAEMLLGGTTCFNDMYFFADETARVADEAGIRACLGMILIDFPTAWARDADEYLAKAVELHDQCRDLALVSTAFSPHAPYSVSDEPLRRVGILAEELDVPVHIHVHETAREVSESIAAHGARPLARLARLGLVSPRLMAVHMTQVDDEDVGMMARAGAHCVHCPESNLKLASGLCPAERLRSAGINVAIGTDGAASNNDLDMVSEMRTAALLAKAVANDASALDAPAALEAATLGGARALAMESLIGSIEVGKCADLAAIHLDRLETLPVFDAVSQIVYSSARSQMTHVWVNGREVVANGELLTLDVEGIVDRVRRWPSRMGEPYVP